MGKDWVLFMHALIRKQTICAIYFSGHFYPLALQTELCWMKMALLKAVSHVTQ